MPSPTLSLLERVEGELGRDWLSWSPDTLMEEVERHHLNKFITTDHGAGDDEALDQLLAAHTAIKTNLPWNDPFLFEKVMLSFNGAFVDPGIWQAARPEEIALGLHELAAVVARYKKRPPSFSPDVIEYIRACCNQYGLLFYPGALKPFQPDQRHVSTKMQEIIAASEDPISVDLIQEQQAKKRADIDAYVESRTEEPVTTNA